MSTQFECAAGVNYNNLGMAAYRKGEYQQAVDHFQKAVEADDTNALAHYNLACTLGIIEKKNDRDDLGPFVPTTLIIHLSRSIELREDRRKRALEDSDLEPIHSTVYFKLLKGTIDLANNEDVKSLLLSRGWSSSDSCGGGLYDNQLEIQPGGKIYAGCRNGCAGESYDLENCVIATAYKIKAPQVELDNIKGRIKVLEIYFDGVEAHIKGLSADGSVLNVWHEFSGYYGSP